MTDLECCEHCSATWTKPYGAGQLQETVHIPSSVRRATRAGVCNGCVNAGVIMVAVLLSVSHSRT
jgi:hypothetical protein